MSKCSKFKDFRTRTPGTQRLRKHQRDCPLSTFPSLTLLLTHSHRQCLLVERVWTVVRPWERFLVAQALPRLILRRCASRKSSYFRTCCRFLTVTILVSQKLSNPWLQGSLWPDNKTLSTFPSLTLLLTHSQWISSGMLWMNRHGGARWIHL